MKAGIKVGYMKTVEARPDVMVPHYVEHNYLGDILNNTRRWAGSGVVNDDLNLTNRISIIADPYMMRCQNEIRYVWWQGVKWEVSSIEWDRPRIILSLGGVYDVPDTDSPELQSRANDIFTES